MTERNKLLFTPKLPLRVLAATLSRALLPKLAGKVVSIRSVRGSATGEATVALVSACGMLMMGVVWLCDVYLCVFVVYREVKYSQKE